MIRTIPSPEFNFASHLIERTTREIKAKVSRSLSDSIDPKSYFATTRIIKVPIDRQAEDLVMTMRYQAISIIGRHEL